MKKVLIYKWGRSVYYGYDHVKKGKRGDIEAEALVEILKDFFDVVVWYDNEAPKDLENVDKIIVFLGPENDIYNNAFIRFIQKHPKIPVVALTTDHRFMGQSLAKYVKHLPVLTNFVGPEKTYENMTFIPCDFVYKASLWALGEYNVRLNFAPEFEDVVLIAANQNQEDIEKSRYNDIKSFTERNSHRQFVVMGTWDSPVEWPENVTFLNTQMHYDDYMKMLSRYSEVAIFQNSADKQPLDDLLDYANTFLPAKAFESYSKGGTITFGNSTLTKDDVDRFVKNSKIYSVEGYILGARDVY